MYKFAIYFNEKRILWNDKSNTYKCDFIYFYLQINWDFAYLYEVPL